MVVHAHADEEAAPDVQPGIVLGDKDVAAARNILASGLVFGGAICRIMDRHGKLVGVLVHPDKYNTMQYAADLCSDPERLIALHQEAVEIDELYLSAPDDDAERWVESWVIFDDEELR